ncbi:MAG: ATP-binding cassette domain-containing protein [Bacteroidota bacterium]
MHSDELILSATNLSYRYGDGPTLSFPDISVTAGQVLLILGPSGCGKTTLLHLLAGLLRPQSGQVVLTDHTYNHDKPAELDQIRGKQLGVVYQQDHFIDTLTAWHNLRLSPYCSPADQLKTIAKELSIDGLLQKYPQDMSTGERQRLGIARALAHRPSLILADEPTSALDRKNCLAVLSLLQEQAERHNAALIIVTHDDRLMENIPNHILLSPVSQASPQ